MENKDKKRVSQTDWKNKWVAFYKGCLILNDLYEVTQGDFEVSENLSEEPDSLRWLFSVSWAWQVLIQSDGRLPEEWKTWEMKMGLVPTVLFLDEIAPYLKCLGWFSSNHNILFIWNFILRLRSTLPFFACTREQRGPGGPEAGAPLEWCPSSVSAARCFTQSRLTVFCRILYPFTDQRHGATWVLGSLQSFEVCNTVLLLFWSI